MKAALRFIAVASAVVLLSFFFRDIIRLGMGISSSASSAPKHFWDALGDAVAWGLEYKEGATAVLIICLVILYIGRDPTIKNR